jgi:hypothetical protein
MDVMTMRQLEKSRLRCLASRPRWVASNCRATVGSMYSDKKGFLTESALNCHSLFIIGSSVL